MKITTSLTTIFSQVETILNSVCGLNNFKLNLTACTADDKEIRFVYFVKDKEIHNEIVYNRETQSFSNPSFWMEGQI